VAQWKRIDEFHDLPYLVASDEVYFAREYKIRGGLSAGETNQLILNFKKAGSKRALVEWQYRQRALACFADELADLLEDAACSLVAVPTSKAMTDRDYTNRFEDLFANLTLRLPLATCEQPLALSASVLPAHEGGDRSPTEIAKQYSWCGLQNSAAELIVIIDDVLTTGGHFRAVHDSLRTNGFRGDIVGAFWARALL
jgi:predicted amidophosphoribosyltransferase